MVCGTLSQFSVESAIYKHDLNGITVLFELVLSV